MKKEKGFEKHIKIRIKGQEELALTFFDQIVYNELKDYLMTYESKYDDTYKPIEDKNGTAREIDVTTILKEDHNDFRIAFRLYSKFNETVEDFECEIIVDGETFIYGIL